MASEKITAIIDSVKELSVLELKELIDTYCEESMMAVIFSEAMVITLQYKWFCLLISLF